MTIRLQSIGYELRPLSASGALRCLRLAAECQAGITPPDGCPGLAEALAENGALASVCLYREGKPAFPTPEDALNTLSIDELCEVYEALACPSERPRDKMKEEV